MSPGQSKEVLAGGQCVGHPGKWGQKAKSFLTQKIQKITK